MKVGDLVRWRPHLPFTFESDYGIIVEIVDEFLVGVLWNNSEYVYMEVINNLEVANDKTPKEDKKGIPNKK